MAIGGGIGVEVYALKFGPSPLVVGRSSGSDNFARWRQRRLGGESSV